MLVNPKLSMFKYPNDKDISIKEVMSFIDRHKFERIPMFEENENYLLQTNIPIELDFLEKEKAGRFMGIRHKNNIANIIVQTHTNYITGSEVAYQSDIKEKDSLEMFLTLRKKSKLNEEEGMISEYCSKYGVSYLLVYLDNIDINTAIINPKECFVLYDYSVEPKPIWGVRYYKNYNDKLVVEVYGKYVFRRFVEDKKGKFVLEEEKENIIKTIPMIEILNNDYMLCDFQPVKTHIDEINKVITTESNLIHYINDALLILRNVDMDEETFAKMLATNLIIMSSGEQGVDADLKFLEKPLNVEAISQHQSTLLKATFRDSFTPLISSEELTKAPSAKALQSMYMSTDFIARTKEKYMKEGLRKVIDIMFKYLNFVKIDAVYTAETIEPKFTRSLPTLSSAELEDVLKIVQAVNLSDETKLGLIPSKYGINPIEEIKRLKNERAEMPYNFESEEEDGGSNDGTVE